MCVCMCICHQEQGTLPWNLMMSLSFPKTVSQCQRWEKIISLHTVNESQRLSQPFLREGYYSAHRLQASLINFSHRFPSFFFFTPSATCGYFQRDSFFSPSATLARKKLMHQLLAGARYIETREHTRSTSPLLLQTQIQHGRVCISRQNNTTRDFLCSHHI